MAKRLSLKNGRMIKKHMHTLKTLSKVGKSTRLNILKKAPNTLFKVLEILFRNCISGLIPISAQHLKRHKQFMKRNSKRGASAIKGSIIQSGGAFPLLLAGLIPVIGNLLSKIF